MTPEVPRRFCITRANRIRRAESVRRARRIGKRERKLDKARVCFWKGVALDGEHYKVARVQGKEKRAIRGRKRTELGNLDKAAVHDHVGELQDALGGLVSSRGACREALEDTILSDCLSERLLRGGRAVGLSKAANLKARFRTLNG